MAQNWSWERQAPQQRKHSSLQPLVSKQQDEVAYQQEYMHQEEEQYHGSLPTPSISSDQLSQSHKKSNKCYQYFPQNVKPTGHSKKGGSDEERHETGLRAPPSSGERLSVGSLPAPKRDPLPGRNSETDRHMRAPSHAPAREFEGDLFHKFSRRSLDYESIYDKDGALSDCEARSTNLSRGAAHDQEAPELDIDAFIANFDRNMLQGPQDKGSERDTIMKQIGAQTSPDNSTSSSNPNTESSSESKKSPTDNKPRVQVVEVEPPIELIQELESFCAELLGKFGLLLQAKRTNAKTHELPAEEWGKAAQVLQQSKKTFTPAEIVEMSKLTREESLKVQSYLKNLTPEELDLYAKEFEPQMEVLMTNKFANYVVQFLLTIHKPTRDAVEKVSLAKFTALVNDEYGSRTMQKACHDNPTYVSKALGSFMANFEKLISTIEGSIFLSKLVVSSCLKSDHLLPLEPLKQKKEYLENAYYTRILSTIAGICEEEVLDQIIELVADHMWLLMNDKFGNYLVLLFFDKHKQQAIESIKQACLANSQHIISRKFPKFILMRFLRAPEHKEFVQLLAARILSHPVDSLLTYIARKENVALFILLLGRLQPKPMLHHAQLLLDEITKANTDKKLLYAELLQNLERLIHLTETTNRSLPCIPAEQAEQYHQD